MKKKISILTAARSEYGLLKPVIKKLLTISEFDVRIAVTGAHLSPEFGFSCQEIEEDGITIDEKIDILLSADNPQGISKSMGLALISFADYFARIKPDLLILLGDRYETLAVAIAAMNQKVPIAHLYGGETTEGAIDEAIRHAISKMSYLHFTSTEKYRKRVIQLGENPERVFNVGALGVENILHEPLLDIGELEKLINFPLDKPYAVITYHPVTLDNSDVKVQIEALLEVLKRNKNLKYIFTKANADANGRIINQMLEHFVAENNNSVLFSYLGVTKYLSLVKYSSLIIGNSSSGIIEAPSFGIPTINIGDRQKGRITADSVINCQPNQSDIEQALKLALSPEFQLKAKNTVNPYGDGHTSEKIVNIIKKFLMNEKVDLKKRFYDCEV